MADVLGILSFSFDIRFVLLVFVGSVAGLFVGAIPGLSVSMATALLVSITYSWQATDALATIMGVYVVGVFSGALSAILINIPGAPSSVVTTLDGYPWQNRGRLIRRCHMPSCTPSLVPCSDLSPCSWLQNRFHRLPCVLLPWIIFCLPCSA